MITHAQLRALGLPPSSINDALRWARLHRVHHGVHSLVPAGVRPPLAAEHAALLACGPHSAISHESAALVHGLRLPEPPRGGELHVTVAGATGRGRSRPGLRVHRTVELHRSELARIGGLRLTSLPRTVIDLAPGLGGRAIEHVVDQALRRTTRSKLAAALARHPRRPGAASVRAVLDPDRPSSDTWSRTERRLRELLRRAGLPAPESNVPIGRLVPDMLWRGQQVVVEYDSDLYHFGPAGRRNTWERHNHLQAQGYSVIHVTWNDLRHHREAVLVRIAAALVRAGWAPG